MGMVLRAWLPPWFIVRWNEVELTKNSEGDKEPRKFITNKTYIPLRVGTLDWRKRRDHKKTFSLSWLEGEPVIALSGQGLPLQFQVACPFEAHQLHFLLPSRNYICISNQEGDPGECNQNQTEKKLALSEQPGSTPYASYLSKSSGVVSTCRSFMQPMKLWKPTVLNLHWSITLVSTFSNRSKSLLDLKLWYLDPSKSGGTAPK